MSQALTQYRNKELDQERVAWLRARCVDNDVRVEYDTVPDIICSLPGTLNDDIRYLVERRKWKTAYCRTTNSTSIRIPHAVTHDWVNVFSFVVFALCVLTVVLALQCAYYKMLLSDLF